MEQRTTDEVWRQITERLNQDSDHRFNTFDEVCGKWAHDRSKLALIVRHPDGSTEHWTYHRLAKQAAKASRMFAEAGLKPGDRVAAMLTRQVEAWVTALAAWRSGLVYVPLFVGFGADAVADRLTAAKATAVVVDHRWRDVVDEASERLDADLDVFTVAGGRGAGLRRGDISFWAEIERAAPDGPVADTTGDTPATLMFTSGTTSTPKGCILPHSAFVALMPYALEVFGVDENDLVFATSDPGWSYGLYTTGATLMALGVPRIVYTGDFDPKAWLRLMDEEEVTFIAGAPSAYRRVLEAARRTGFPASLRGANTAGEPLDRETAQKWSELAGFPLRDGYGLTEVGMVLGDTIGSPVNEHGTLSGTVPGFEVALVDDDGAPVESGRGRVAVRRPPFQLSIGYANAPDAWQRRWIDDWFVTDDLMERTEQGGWRFYGRADDVIVTSGYNVGPAEVESTLLEDPGVAEVAVVAAPDASRGQIVRAVVVKSREAPSDDELIKRLQDRVRTHIGRHAYPRIVEFRDELPRTATGKLRRASLRPTE
ncbi:hypothetical protein BHE97_09490 [Aeromicrobium sp. PE09-221]|uniref:AMP-binding protein n=1 Tax=Aeromicrobium sp. PE09-221 TaxID=1898043 RepID=UPI000B3E7CCD|nr:AMP-binding protein [Aeromicrobium sp. PE09-221]OUZ09690.1 hypothetical protein BHE97_09490 [Aeromicrobium sp. PE09-221]